jgi:hypothetical protein
MPWAQISGRQAPGLTQGSPPFYITNAEDEPRGLASWDVGPV